MTREKRLELLKQIEKDIHVCSIESTFLDDAKSCAIHSVIEELEQEPILDKIRAEIAEYGSIWVGYKITGRRDKDIEQLVSDVLSQAKKQVLDVIDKYKAESEDT